MLWRFVTLYRKWWPKPFQRKRTTRRQSGCLKLLFGRSVLSDCSTTPRTAAHLASLFFTISQSLLRLTSIESVMPSNHLILCRHLLFLPSVFPSIRVFSNELTLRISWPKVLKLHLQHQSFSEYSGLIFFRIDWFYLLAVQVTLGSLLQNHTSKASVLWCSAALMVLLSHPYMTTGKTITLTIRTFVGKVMSLLFNMLFRFVIAFLPRSKCLNFMAAVTICSDFGAQENEVCHCFHCFPIYLPWSDVWGGFLNSLGKKRSKRQGRKGKIH